ncbi:HU family DNA-binding protein [Candidatus Foliamicus sp.]
MSLSSPAASEAAVTRSELVRIVTRRLLEHERFGYFSSSDLEASVQHVIELMVNTLASGGGIEIRGFGSFKLSYRSARIGRNPRTGEPVALPSKYVPKFRPGKRLRERVNTASKLPADASAARS